MFVSEKDGVRILGREKAASRAISVWARRLLSSCRASGRCLRYPETEHRLAKKRTRRCWHRSIFTYKRAPTQLGNSLTRKEVRIQKREWAHITWHYTNSVGKNCQPKTNLRFIMKRNGTQIPFRKETFSFERDRVVENHRLTAQVISSCAIVSSGRCPVIEPSASGCHGRLGPRTRWPTFLPPTGCAQAR